MTVGHKGVFGISGRTATPDPWEDIGTFPDADDHGKTQKRYQEDSAESFATCYELVPWRIGSLRIAYFIAHPFLLPATIIRN